MKLITNQLKIILLNLKGMLISLAKFWMFIKFTVFRIWTTAYYIEVRNKYLESQLFLDRVEAVDEQFAKDMFLDDVKTGLIKQFKKEVYTDVMLMLSIIFCPFTALKIDEIFL